MGLMSGLWRILRLTRRNGQTVALLTYSGGMDRRSKKTAQGQSAGRGMSSLEMMGMLPTDKAAGGREARLDRLLAAMGTAA